MKLLTKAQHEKMLKNGIRSIEDKNYDPKPVVKFFTPDGNKPVRVLPGR